MANREYRSKLYENYAKVQKPEWSESHSGADAVWRAAALRRLSGWLPADRKAKCLDLGCGSGLLLESLRQAGYFDLQGVDLGGPTVDLARKRGFEVVQDDLRDFLQKSNERFDLITAFDVVEHFGKDEIIDVLTLIHDRLSPGGLFILQTPNAMSPWSASYRYHDLTHEWIFDPHCIAALLQLVGFQDIRIREITPYVHGAFSAMRWALWNLIRIGCAVWNFAETGSAQGGVYTRNMVVVGSRSLDTSC
jgi:2-polyprenyl-3-methyl-5-hydroxy-6-metoxy-1,4-benzoquinol methylase